MPNTLKVQFQTHAGSMSEVAAPAPFEGLLIYRLDDSVWDKRYFPLDRLDMSGNTLATTITRNLNLLRALQRGEYQAAGSLLLRTNTATWEAPIVDEILVFLSWLPGTWKRKVKWFVNAKFGPPEWRQRCQAVSTIRYFDVKETQTR